MNFATLLQALLQPRGGLDQTRAPDTPLPNDWQYAGNAFFEPNRERAQFFLDNALNWHQNYRPYLSLDSITAGLAAPRTLDNAYYGNQTLSVPWWVNPEFEQRFSPDLRPWPNAPANPPTRWNNDFNAPGRWDEPPVVF
jgi:hypothetical protein